MADEALKPHDVCFDELGNLQREQMKAHGTDAALAAAMAIGHLAAAVVPDNRRKIVSELAAELMQRWAGAMAIAEHEVSSDAN